MLPSGSLHHLQTQRDTLNQLYLLLVSPLLSSHWSKKTSQPLFSLPLSYSHTHAKKHFIPHPAPHTLSTNHFITHNTVSTCLKTGLIILAVLDLFPSVIIYRSSFHHISDMYQNHISLGAHVSCTVGMQDRPLATGRGRVCTKPHVETG